jgi:hypothetical protein
MADRFEDKIRDYLADHLELLETGLVLVDKEHELHTSLGAGGRIDILARDIYGHVVVIEIKRSDQSARQALNEIHKYVALFRISQGLDESGVRLMVVSTDWHELRLPLSEFAETTAYPVEAISIAASPDGAITGVSRITLLQKTPALKISRVQCIYLYETATRRDNHLVNLIDAVKETGIQDFAIFRCDHSGDDPRIMFPYGHYLCFSPPTLTLSKQELKMLKTRNHWDNGLDEPDENFVSWMRTGLSDSFEIGYPEKLTNLRADWSVSVSTRSGRLDRRHSVLADEEIIRLAQAVGGGSSIYVGKTSSPRFKTAWKQLRADIKTALIGNSRWQQVVPRYLKEIETRMPTATVSAFLYNPTNLFLSLYFIASNEDYSKCPYLEIVVEDKDSGTVKVLIGFLAWDGHQIHAAPDDLINQIFGDDFSWIAAVAMHGTCEEEDDALASHHLTAVTTEWRFEGNREDGPTEILIEKGRIARRPFGERNYRPMPDFMQAHSDYLAALKRYVQDRIAGLPGSDTA